MLIFVFMVILMLIYTYDDIKTRFKIVDPLEFYKTVGSESNVRNRLNSNVISSLRRVVGTVTLDELLSEDCALAKEFHEKRKSPKNSDSEK